MKLKFRIEKLSSLFESENIKCILLYIKNDVYKITGSEKEIEKKKKEIIKSYV